MHHIEGQAAFADQRYAVMRTPRGALRNPASAPFALALSLLAAALYEDLVYYPAFKILADSLFQGGRLGLGAVPPYERALVFLTSLTLVSAVLLGLSVRAAFARRLRASRFLAQFRRFLLALVALTGVGILGNTFVVMQRASDRGVEYLAWQMIPHVSHLEAISLAAVLAITGLAFSVEPLHWRSKAVASHLLALAALISLFFRARLAHAYLGPLCLAAAWTFVGFWLLGYDSPEAVPQTQARSPNADQDRPV